ncbi:MAG: hypothetical protein WCH11_02190 [Bdellovibrio sp.]
MNILKAVQTRSRKVRSGRNYKPEASGTKKSSWFRQKLASFPSRADLGLFCLALQLIFAGSASAKDYEFIEGFWESSCEKADPQLFGSYSKLVLRIEKQQAKSYHLQAGLFIYGEEGCESSSIVQAFQQTGKFEATSSINNPRETHDVLLVESLAQWKPSFRMESILATNPEQVPPENRAEYLAVKKAAAVGQAVAESIKQLTQFQFALKTIADPRGLQEQVDSLKWIILGPNSMETLLYRGQSLDLMTQRAGQLRKLPKYLRTPKNPQET